MVAYLDLAHDGPMASQSIRETIAAHGEKDQIYKHHGWSVRMNAASSFLYSVLLDGFV